VLTFYQVLKFNYVSLNATVAQLQNCQL